MNHVTLYTDGACSGNPGPGGWGCILMCGNQKKELSGGEAQTTNNRMELTGVISGLQALAQPCAVDLYSDSKYVVDALEKGWAKGWRAHGWVKSDKKKALNPDLWEKLLDLCDYHQVTCHWVKGHATNPYNNRCDELAVMERLKFEDGGQSAVSTLAVESDGEIDSAPVGLEREYGAYRCYYQPLSFYKDGKVIYAASAGAKDVRRDYIQCGSAEYMRGWLYGAVQVARGQHRRMEVQ